MSLVFKPKLPEQFNFASGKKQAMTPKTVKPRKSKAWTNHDLNTLIELRALALPHVDCGIILKRQAADCSSAVHKHQLQRAIKARRKVLITGVLTAGNSSQT